MRFIVYRDRRGSWRWRLVARNGRIVADGGEGYAKAFNCRRAIRAVKGGLPPAKIHTIKE